MEKLPSEILEKIFKYLRPVDIENAADVCLSWREAIATSTPLMQRLTCNIRDFRKFSKLMDSMLGESHKDREDKWRRLPYRNFETSFNFFGHNILKEIDPKIIHQFYLNEPLTLLPTEYLMNFQNLTTFVFENHAMNDTTTKIDLPNLNHLKCCLCFLPCIQSPKVEFLSLLPHKESRRRESMDDEALQNFIPLTFSNVKHLTLNEFFLNQISGFENQLTSLEIMNVAYLPIDCKSLFESQKASLKNLHLDANQIDDELSDFIYHEMNLEKLIDRRKIRGNFNELKDVKIKNLAINCGLDKVLFVQRLLTCCNDLEVLEVNIFESKELKLLGYVSRLPKLKYLKLRGSNEKLQVTQVPKICKMPHIEELILPKYGLRNYTYIALGCPNLKRLETKANLTPNVIEEIFKFCPKIEEIDLGTIDHLTMEMLEVFKIAASKVTFKCELKNEYDYGRLVQLKNRVVISLKDRRSLKDDKDYFSLTPKMLTELYGDIRKKRSHDLFV